jgi:catechol 2,3-dioxygenase-like lactoylglutathione lyase family enzyme
VSPQFDFLGVPVSDMARSVAFYRLLGLDFPEGAENESHTEAPLPGGMRYALDAEDVIRSFDADWKRPTDGYAGGGAFRCSSPEEVDRVYRKLLAAGGSAHKEPWDSFWGQRYAQVRDPDGTVIDLYAALPDS